MLLRHLLPLPVAAWSGVCNAGGRGTDYSRREQVRVAHHGEQKRRTWRGPDVTRLAVTLNARRGQTLHVWSLSRPGRFWTPTTDGKRRARRPPTPLAACQRT